MSSAVGISDSVPDGCSGDVWRLLYRPPINTNRSGSFSSASGESKQRSEEWADHLFCLFERLLDCAETHEYHLRHSLYFCISLFSLARDFMASMDAVCGLLFDSFF